MSVKRADKIFRHAYSKNLLASNVITSGGLLMFGDAIQQNIELYRGLHSKGG